MRAGELSAWGPTAQQTVAELTEAGLLRARPGAWYWTRPEPATSLTDLRGGLGTVQIVEEGTAVVLGYQDAAGADAALHTGAVYTHQGTTFMVVDYQPEARIAYVRAAAVDFTTWARWDSAVRILSQQRSVTWSEHLHGGWGTVEVSTQVSGYQRRRPIDSAVLGTYPLDMPQRSLTTAGCWVTMSDAFLAAAGLTPEQLPGALHAAEHGAIGILPLLATCDRLDLGGLSTARHEQTGLATIIVHDAFPGGAGFSEHGFSVAVAWLTATRDAIRSCPCATGCPACVQSPKCGNGNQPLDKAASVALLSAIIAEATT